jgi:cell division protein FtsB
MLQKAAWATIGVLAVILVFVAFVPKVKQYHDLQKVEVQKSADVRIDQETLDQLKWQQGKLRTDPRFVERVAREEHGLTKPGELVFKFVDDEPASNAPPRRK